MSLKELKENKLLCNQLEKLLLEKRLVHAFLFSGGSEKSRKALGLAFAKAVLCPNENGDSCEVCISCKKFENQNHSDFLLIQKPKDKSSIVVEQIENLQYRLSLKPEGEKYCVLIENAQLMNIQVQNKLLKLLEEPKALVVFILLAENAKSLLPTVQSRCSCYYLEEAVNPIDEEIQKAAENLVLLTLKAAPFYEKKKVIQFILDNKENAREKGLLFLNAYEEKLLEFCIKDSENAKILILAENFCKNARQYLKLGHNVGYTLKQLCLKI